MKRKALVLTTAAALLLALWIARDSHESARPPSSPPQLSTAMKATRVPTASELLLEGYADPATPPVEDLRKLHRLMAGYFSVVKDATRFPIGGNEDLAAALRGENPNREMFLRQDHPIFSDDGLLLDRWNTPLIVHPEGWGRIEFRSAGSDRLPFTDDDLVVPP